MNYNILDYSWIPACIVRYDGVLLSYGLSKNINMVGWTSMTMGIYKLFFKLFFIFLAVFSILTGTVFYFLSGSNFAAGIIAGAVVMAISFLSLANEVKSLIIVKSSMRFIRHFILRLACFAFLLYVLLVKLNLPAIGFCIGLTLAVISNILAVILVILVQKNKVGYTWNIHLR